MEVLRPALRHGIADEDIHHAIDHAVTAEEVGDDPVRWLAPGTRFPIARLCYTSTTRRWVPYRPDRHLRLHRHDQLPPSPRAGDLFEETGGGPIAIFWG